MVGAKVVVVSANGAAGPPAVPTPTSTPPLVTCETPKALTSLSTFTELKLPPRPTKMPRVTVV